MEDLLRRLIRDNRELTIRGNVARYIPQLSKADPATLGVAVCDLGGGFALAGDTSTRFTLQSVSKPFALALALMDNGPEEVFNHIGMEPTGDSFNSLTKLETFSSLKPVNPLVNAGAITTTALIKGASQAEKFSRLASFVQELAGEEYVGFDEDVYLSEKETGDRNRSIAYFLRDIGALQESVEDTLDLYFRQCAIEVDCRSLAKMATALATEDEGLIPMEYRRIIRTFMFTCGMYDASGEFAIKAGIPSKSGVSGGIMAVIPGRYGIATLGPSLDAKGNSVAGIAVMADLSRELNLYVF